MLRLSVLALLVLLLWSVEDVVAFLIACSFSDSSSRSLYPLLLNCSIISFICNVLVSTLELFVTVRIICEKGIDLKTDRGWKLLVFR